MSVTDWQDYCERLWGPDWIAPLSEVLGINRRTVERWRSGKTRVPYWVERVIVAGMPIPRADRVYGDVLRRVANGESTFDIIAAAEAVVEAAQYFEEQRAAGDPLALRTIRED